MKMTGRIVGLLMAALFAFAPACAEGYWQTLPAEGLICREDRPGCHLLQMAMAGSFSQLDTRDSISVRVFSAVLPQLRALREADFAHFCAQFDVKEEIIRQIYYIAMGNCLLADITMGAAHTPDEAAAYRVLLLFLNPEGEEDAQAQKDVIRAEMDDAILSVLAGNTGLPEDFIAYLIEHDEWNVLP